MEVYERINLILDNKNMSKREFSNKLRDLEPKLKSTGEIPSEKTIYKYLNGSISIKIELIPYIAEALNIREQELFTHDKNSRKKFFQNMIKTANEEEMNILENKLALKQEFSSMVSQPKVEYGSKSLEQELINLIPYAPKPLLQNMISKLKDLKEFNENI